MNQVEFQQKMKDFQDKLGIWDIGVRQKKLGQFTLGYYWDEPFKTFIVYEVDERQNFIEWQRFRIEEQAIDGLYDLIKYRLWID